MLCPDCAAPKAPGARFCHQCGRKLDTASTGLKAGDRRVVTALFADLVGYTQLVDQLDPEEVRTRVDGALTVLGDAVMRFDGSLEKFVGDAVLAVFGAPTAHDDDALRACLCALEMQAALARLGEGSDRPLRLRVGIATGEVVAAVRDLVGVRSVALTGDCMTTAARLQQLAEPAEVLLDEATVQAAEPRIGVDRIGERLLRGQSRPILIHHLRDERRRGRSFGRATRLVGRDAERRRLAEVIRRTARTGRGSAVLVSGEAGIGKSRLLSEMESEVRAAGFGWVWIDNPPHRMGAPFHTVRAMIDALADEFGVKAGIMARQIVGSPLDEETARLLFGAAAVLARDSEMQLLPEEGWDQRFAGLSDPAELATGLQLAAKSFLSGLVATQPRCFVLDDYHWMDPSSQLMLAEMVRLAAELPIVVFTSIRPPLKPEWTSLPHVEVIELGGLDEAATEALGTAVGGAELEPESARWLFQRTAGNALFIGEVIRMLRASGRMEHVGDWLRIDREAARRSVPLSLRALLGARIDALPPSQRSALEVAAVIGVTFPEWLLCELEGRSDMGDDLCQLADAGILVRCEDESGLPDGACEPSGCWRFRHQLFHDAAYGRLLTDRKQQLHTALADRLETVEPATDAAELARHRIAAGDVARALPLLQRAVLEAEAMGAVAEAEAFRQAATALQDGRTVPNTVH
jgi:adenylate cyclase